ncbi:unnamed protein product [Lasius platythorax]|uniref:Uncharacterized protein n=1 Tax=Lasius platythorax TaxID=488582 RepID=A0AAV2MYG2_9HYME
MHFIRICVLFVYLSAAPIVYASDMSPTIHAIPLQNDTLVPEEYRKLPSVAKCCPVNQVFVKKKGCLLSNDSSMMYFSPLFSEYTRTGVFTPREEFGEFVALVGIPCNERYMLLPERSDEDTYYLLLNGSIFAPNIGANHTPMMLMPGKDYCMEVVPRIPWGPRVFVCYPEGM